MWPVVGESRPAIRRRRVDLPQPEGPRMAMNWAVGMVRSRELRAVTPPGKVRLMPWSVIDWRGGATDVVGMGELLGIGDGGGVWFENFRKCPKMSHYPRGGCGVGHIFREH
jgi:hypothetical protein